MALALSRERREERTSEAVRSAITRSGGDRVGLVFKVSLLAWLMSTVLSDALPYLNERGTGEFLNGRLSSRTERFGVSQGIIGSVWILVFVAVLAFPVGVAAAVYLEEYARNTRLNRVLVLTIRNLSGVPSVVYGILGLVVFKELLGGGDDAAWWQFTGGSSLISAGLTMAILVLPIVIITSAEALRAVRADALVHVVACELGSLASVRQATVPVQAQSTPRLQEYLVAHQAYAPGGAMIGGARNIRTVAASGDAR